MSKIVTMNWTKLRRFVSERKPISVVAGLSGDWFWTAATVYEKGKYIKDHGAFTHSYHDTPCFEATMPNGDTVKVMAYRAATPKDEAMWAKQREETRERMRQLAEEIRNRRNAP